MPQVIIDFASAVVVVGLAIALGMWYRKFLKRTAVRQIAPAKTESLQPPLIRMAFNGQEFAIRETHDMGDHWYFVGYITQSGGYGEVENISFRVRKGVKELRLGYYMNYNHVLVNISDPDAKMPECFLADTDRVWTDFVPFPKPM